MSGFTAPVGDSKKIENVELIPQGFQLCTLTALIDVGHQEGKFGLKRQCKMIFEFPLHKRVFYEGEEARPASVIIGETLSLSNGSNLRDKWVPQMFMRVISDEEAKTFDLSQFLGKHYVATIAHSIDGKYANISALTPLDASNCGMFQLTTPSIQQINPTRFFHISQGFESENFANLPKYFRNMLMNSTEGKQHQSVGGKFAEPPKENSNNGIVNSPPNSNSKYTWLEQGTTYDQYIAGGWNDTQLLTAGKMKLNEPVAPPPVAPPPIAPPPTNTPIGSPPAPSIPVPPSTPPPPPSEPVLVFKDPAHTWEAFQKEGWTKEGIVEAGFATFQ